ncbi:FecR domain-containing protein [Planctomycetales bacterium ZRK34]|nr:FecR domain-containing protein [Planctomycetales bacterium ZRK34]
MPDPARDASTDLGPMILGFLDDTLTAEQLAELDAHLESDPAARDLMVHICTHASLINEKLADSLHVSEQDTGDREQAPTPTLRLRRSVWYAAAALIALAVTAWFVFDPGARSTPPSPTATRSVALLTNTAGAVFTDSSVPMDLGAELAPGLIQLQSGTAQIMFHRGAVVSLVAPCSFRILDDNRGRLDSGALEATVPPGAVGFSIDGPRGVRVVDLGTEFRMVVDARRRTEVYVVRGRVRLALADQPGAEHAAMELAARDAGVFDPSMSSRMIQPLEPGTFLRNWWRHTGADRIDAMKTDAALLDTNGDGIGDSTFVPRRGSVAVGEQNSGADRHPLRYYLPFDLTDEQRAVLASADRIELAITLNQVQNVDELTMRLIGLTDHEPVSALPTDYHAAGQTISDAAMTADTPVGPVFIDVTDFVRAQAQAGHGVAFRCELIGAPLPHVDSKINNFIVNTSSHADESCRPYLKLHWK